MKSPRLPNSKPKLLAGSFTRRPTAGERLRYGVRVPTLLFVRIRPMVQKRRRG